MMQIMLLTREMFSSSLALYELETGDRKTYRDKLCGNIFANSKRSLPERKDVFSLADEIDEAFSMIGKDDLSLSNSLLDIRSIAPKRLMELPHTFMIGTALETAILPSEIRPRKIGEFAFEVCLQQLPGIYRTSNAENFVKAVINETADDCLRIMSVRKETLAYDRR